MMKSFTLSVLLLVSLTPASFASLWLPALFSDHMVLQAGKAIRVWGKASPGAEIKVSFSEFEGSGIADADGKWLVILDAVESGIVGELRVLGDGEEHVCRDVLVGELWICSGQSNMEWRVSGAMNSKAEQEAADYPQIRFFEVENRVSGELRDDVAGQWLVCSPETVGGFSAVAYFFARSLHEAHRFPVGVIAADWGGTPAESWTPIETLRSDPDFAEIVNNFDNQYGGGTKFSYDDYRRELKDWEEEVKKMRYYDDPGNDGEAGGWAEPGADLSGWEKTSVPGYWEKSGLEIDGVVWYRREVMISSKMAGRELSLELGGIDDFDTSYWNGTLVGRTGKEVPNHWIHPRKYRVPAELVKEGVNTLAVRIFDHYGAGGFGGAPEEMKLVGGGEELPLAGEWLYRIAHKMDPKRIPPRPRQPAWMPSGLYNAMIHPLIPYTIRGVIWYQGESNTGRAYQYRKLFPAMISAWRERWKQGDFPFLFVQLANYMKRDEFPQESSWAELREAQAMSLELPNTGMAVAIDIGEADDIHPRNKQEVGRRLALLARAKVYGEDIVFSGPIYGGMEKEDAKIRIKFDYIGDGLAVKGGGELTGFAIAGEDKKFVWAQAEIDGGSVIVHSPVAEPLAVRYAWGNNPECNLINTGGLPAVPFRTDDWDGETKGK